LIIFAPDKECRINLTTIFFCEHIEKKVSASTFLGQFMELTFIRYLMGNQICSFQRECLSLKLSIKRLREKIGKIGVQTKRDSRG